MKFHINLIKFHLILLHIEPPIVASTNHAATLENAKEARSNLLDLDVAAELTDYASNKILTQTSVAMLGRISEMRQNLLRLLEG